MEQNKRQVLGILGGLGPAASCYLYQMLIDHTPARKDQDHIDLVLSSRASTPDRTAFITGQSDEDPFDIMEQDGRSLVRYGATVLAIPCNTAHYFYDRLAAALPVPVLNMPRLTVADARAAGCRKLGILATDGTLLAETYQIACRDAGIGWAAPSPEQKIEKQRPAQKGGDGADGQDHRGDGRAGKQVAQQKQRSPRQQRAGDEIDVIVAHRKPHQMRSHQADEADEADLGHNDRAGQTAQQHARQRQAPHVDAKAHRHLFAAQQGVVVPAVEHAVDHQKRHHRPGEGKVGHVGAAQVAKGPEH